MTVSVLHGDFADVLRIASETAGEQAAYAMIAAAGGGKPERPFA